MNYLKSKAEDNYKIAEIAEQKKCFDVAVSRYYYYIFQHLLNFLSLQGITIEKGKDKHSETIGAFIKIIKDKGNYENNRDIAKLWSIREKRNTSDYNKDEKIADRDEFEKIFKKDFNDVYNTFNSLNII